MHTSTLRAVGASVSVALPRQLLSKLGLKAGDKVKVRVESGKLVLSRTEVRYRLADLLKGMEPGDMPVAPEWQQETPAGREAW